MNTNVKFVSFCGLFIALVAVATMVLHVPIPASNGYIHIGDAVILLICFFFKGKYGIISASFGSMLADILTGYAGWALFSLVIKALMAFVMVKLCDNEKPILGLKNTIAVVSCELLMIVGYFLAGIVLYGSVQSSIVGVFANIIQGLSGIFIFFVFATAFEKTGILRGVKL